MGDPPADEWWRSYFDEIFHRLYTPHLPPDATREEAEGVVEALGLEPGDRVLDLACGWGRHALVLAREGLRVTGLDRSAALLGRARRAAAEEGVPVHWVRADVREIPFRGCYDAVVSLFSSLGYFLSEAEDARVLREVRRTLRPEGLFLLETMHRDLVAREYAERDWWEAGDGTTVWVERDFDAVAGVSRERLRWRRGQESGEKEHSIRIRSATEWAALLDSTGLEAIGWYGGWDLAPFSHESERLIVCARARPG